MKPMPMSMDDGASPEESEDIERQLLEELREYTRGAMAGDMRERYGKPPLTEDAPEEEAMESPDEEAAEDPSIPGVEGMAPGEGDGEAGGEGLDVAKLKAVLAKLKAG